MQPPPSAPVAGAKTALAGRLKQLRIEAGLTARDLAGLAAWPRTKVSKIEHARQPPSRSDIEIWCEHTNAIGQVDELVAAMHAVEGHWVEWRQAVRPGGLRGVQESYVPLFQRTRQFRIYEAFVIPGLFQTEEYARARITRFAAVHSLSEDVDQAVIARLARQSVVTSGDHTFAVVLEQAALHARVGSEEMMAAQLGYLITIAAHPRVSLGVVPAGVDRTVGASPGFWLYDSDVVTIETPSAQLTVTTPGEIQVYARTFSELASMAVYGRHARILIADAIQALGR